MKEITLGPDQGLKRLSVYQHFLTHHRTVNQFVQFQGEWNLNVYIYHVNVYIYHVKDYF